MLKTHFHKNIIWYDFLQPTAEKYLPLAKEFSIDPYINEKFLGKINRDKALILGNHLFLAISIPDLQDGEYKKQELKFILDEVYMITSSDTINEGMEIFKKNFEDNAHFQKGEEFENPVIYSFLHLIEKVYENMIFELQSISVEIDSIEKDIFSNNGRKMVIEISETNKKLIDFGKHIRSHEETWEIFLSLSKEFFAKKHSHEALESITLSYQKVMSEWNHQKETLHELRDTNNSLLNAKLSETSKTFTLIAFLTLPISLFISIISIPTQQGHFFSKNENDFYYIIAMSSILFIFTLGFSKWKKWW